MPQEVKLERFLSTHISGGSNFKGTITLEEDGKSYTLDKYEVDGKTYLVNPISETEEVYIDKTTNRAYFAHRILSNDHVAVGTQRHTDFTQVDFGKYIELITRVPLYTDHKAEDALASIGSIITAFVDKGDDAGLTAITGVDTTMPNGMKAAKKVKKGDLIAGSVSVGYSWVQSHEVANFNSKIGIKADDGTYYRRVAQDILSFREYSFLHNPADTKAHVRSGGKNAKKMLVNSYSFSDIIDFTQANKQEQVVIEKVVERFTDVTDPVTKSKAEMFDSLYDLKQQEVATAIKTLENLGDKPYVALPKAATIENFKQLDSWLTDFNKRIEDKMGIVRTNTPSNPKPKGVATTTFSAEFKAQEVNKLTHVFTKK